MRPKHGDLKNKSFTKIKQNDRVYDHRSESQFKQFAKIARKKDFQGFNGIRTRGLCVSAAVLSQLSYEDPYTGGWQIYWVHQLLTRERNETLNGMMWTAGRLFCGIYCPCGYSLPCVRLVPVPPPRSEDLLWVYRFFELSLSFTSGFACLHNWSGLGRLGVRTPREDMQQ